MRKSNPGEPGNDTRTDRRDPAAAHDPTLGKRMFLKFGEGFCIYLASRRFDTWFKCAPLPAARGRIALMSHDLRGGLLKFRG